MTSVLQAAPRRKSPADRCVYDRKISLSIWQVSVGPSSSHTIITWPQENMSIKRQRLNSNEAHHHWGHAREEIDSAADEWFLIYHLRSINENSGRALIPIPFNSGLHLRPVCG
jgi:hypothetical protein